MRQQISVWQRSLPLQPDLGHRARLVKAENLHLTLRFLGAVETSHIDALRLQLDTIEQSGFELQLQGLGYFAAPRILWLGLNTVPPALLQLVDAVQRAVAVALPEHQAGAESFTPHISLARNAQVVAAAECTAVIVWPVHEFVLVESVNSSAGTDYRVLQRWPLR